MQQMELVRNGNANEIVLSLGAPVPDVALLGQQAREFKGIVMDWVSHRGDAAREVSLLLITTPENFQSCLSFFEEVHDSDVDLKQLFRHVSFNLNVTNGTESLTRSFPA